MNVKKFFRHILFYVLAKLRAKCIISINKPKEVYFMGMIADGRGANKTAESNQIKAKILKFVKKNPGKTKVFYCEKIGISLPTLNKHVKSLINEGLLEV